MSKVVRQIINTSKSALPAGPYNQAVKVDNVVYVSGVVGIEKNASKITAASVQEESRVVMTNLRNVLEAAGSGLDKLVKATVFLNDINDFAAVNDIYKEFISKDYPARSCFQVGKLPLGARIEIEAIGLCGDVVTEAITV